MRLYTSSNGPGSGKVTAMGPLLIFEKKGSSPMDALYVCVKQLPTCALEGTNDAARKVSSQSYHSCRHIRVARRFTKHQDVGVKKLGSSKVHLHFSATRV